MKKKLTILIVLVISVFVFTSCGAGESKDEIPSDDSILDDINSSDIVLFLFAGEPQTLKATQVEVSKAKLEDGGKATIYCTTEQSDDNYNCKGDYILYYSFYEKGGWMIDSFDVNSQKMIANAPPSEKEITTYLTQSGYENIKDVKVKGNKDNTTCTVTCTGQIIHKYMNENYSFNITGEFTSDGWIYDTGNFDYKEDWSKLEGTTWKKTDGDKYDIVTVESFDVDTMRVTLSSECFNGSGSIKCKETGEILINDDNPEIDPLSEGSKYTLFHFDTEPSVFVNVWVLHVDVDKGITTMTGEVEDYRIAPVDITK